MKPNPNPEA